ncbi:hypothetical protein [Ideonella sp. A 288]|uniref:hypothetical protein n=1 Tax=Ideonella sp. A 288 TaxID=1962181 RepID=UPI0011865C6B|nr:hypothetical protein [Ideonella sp. A 288]
MTSFTPRPWLVLWIAAALAMPGCALGPRMVDHAFGFDALADSPQVEILHYRYGSTNAAFVSADTAIRQFGKSMQATNINGPIPLGDTLYVKWRLKATGQTFEETVDLKSVLPREMERQRVYFVVQADHLFVYLTDLTKPRPDSAPIVGPFRVQSYVTRQIHPATPPTTPHR